MSFKDPSFQDRIGSAAKAKKKALDHLRSKPPLDEKIVAERQARRLERETRDAQKAPARKAARQAAKIDEAAAKAAIPPPPTDAERKAARDARYAARKARK